MLTEQEIDNKIRELCVASNPSIMDLVFGCEISRRFEQYHHIIIDANAVNGSYRFENDIIMTKEMIEQEKGLEILGRPLQLADILLAMNEKELKLANGNTEKLLIDNSELPDIMWAWNLTLPYSQQSLETKIFLLELLTK